MGWPVAYRVIIYRAPEFLASSRPNWVPHPLPRKRMCLSAYDPKVGGGGSNTRLRVRGWGTHFGRLARKPGTLYTQWHVTFKGEKEEQDFRPFLFANIVHSICDFTDPWII
jgi:hypothetical protein